jgi:hypothetical protein
MFQEYFVSFSSQTIERDRRPVSSKMGFLPFDRNR